MIQQPVVEGSVLMGLLFFKQKVTSPGFFDGPNMNVEIISVYTCVKYEDIYIYIFKNMKYIYIYVFQKNINIFQYTYKYISIYILLKYTVYIYTASLDVWIFVSVWFGLLRPPGRFQYH